MKRDLDGWADPGDNWTRESHQTWCEGESTCKTAYWEGDLMLRITYAEDEKQERERIDNYLHTYAQTKGLALDISCFEDGEKLLECYPEKTDILLLDIEMKQMDGMTAARQIREFDRRVQILFVTNLISYAIEGYEVQAADFLVKPIRYPVFASRMDRVLERIQVNQPRFLLTSYAKEKSCCQIQEIAYIESANKKTYIHLTDGTVQMSSEPLYILEEKLSDEPFYRCHNAFVVNLAKIRSMDGAEILIGQTRIPVSKYRKKDFLQALTGFRGRML